MCIYIYMCTPCWKNYKGDFFSGCFELNVRFSYTQFDLAAVIVVLVVAAGVVI